MSLQLKIFSFFFLSFLLSGLFIVGSLLITKTTDDPEQLTAYECGFNPYNDARKVFDVKFYLVSIFFLIFDLETIFLFPWSITINCNFSLGFLALIDFLIELIVGYVYIWGLGALEWH